MTFPDFVQRFVDQARGRPVRVVYPESEDPRILAAACAVAREGIAVPVLLGDPDVLARCAQEKGLCLDGAQRIPLTDSSRLERYTTIYAESRNLRPAIARKVIAKPLAFGGMMLRTGEADAMVAGAAHPTASVIQAASLTVGLEPGLSTPSSYFVMVMPEFRGRREYPLIFSDCALNVSPTSEQLADIAAATATSARSLLTEEPAVAFLSFSTHGSANHSDVDKVRAAVQIARERYPNLRVDGELQGDAALMPSVAQKKTRHSLVAGQANILIFPDLDAGNIAYKLVQYLAGALALGPLLQGFAKPVTDLSRGATVEDIVGITAILVCQAQRRTAA